MATSKQPAIKAPKSTVLLRLIDEIQNEFEPEYVNELLEELLIYAFTNEKYAVDHANSEMMYDHFSLVFKLRKIMAELLKVPLWELEKVLEQIKKC